MIQETTPEKLDKVINLLDDLIKEVRIADSNAESRQMVTDGHLKNIASSLSRIMLATEKSVYTG